MNYQTALKEWQVEAKKWGQARKAYRARTIGDTEFLKAKAEFEVAQAKLDAVEKQILDAAKE